VIKTIPTLHDVILIKWGESLDGSVGSKQDTKRGNYEYFDAGINFSHALLSHYGPRYLAGNLELQVRRMKFAYVLAARAAWTRHSVIAHPDRPRVCTMGGPEKKKNSQAPAHVGLPTLIAGDGTRASRRRRSFAARST